MGDIYEKLNADLDPAHVNVSASNYGGSEAKSKFGELPPRLVRLIAI